MPNRIPEIDRLVEEYLNSIPQDEALSIIGEGTYTADELRDEFRRRTAVGERLAEMVLDGTRGTSISS